MDYKILRLPEVINTTGLSRSSIYAYIKAGRFPEPVRIGARATGWPAKSIQEWVESRNPASLQAD